MKYYTLTDLSDAKWLLETQDRLDHGSMVNWADDVINWFRALFKVARLFHRNWLNDWQLSLKAVWQSIKAMKYTKQLFKLLRSIRQKASAKVVSSIRKYRYERVSKRDCELLSCTGRTDKSNLRIRRAQDANFRQSVTIKQSWQSNKL